jgi:hypothetical protein
MKRIIAAVIASAFAFGTVSTFAADAAKKDELTVEQRSELRERAARMKEQGQQTTAPAQEKVHEKSMKQKHSDKHSAKHSTKHVKKSAKHSSKKTHHPA